MSLLLDTQVLLWAGAEEEKLSHVVREALTVSADKELLVSVASLWGIVLKVQVGKLTLPQPMDQFVDELMALDAVRLLPIEPHHLVQILNLPSHHRDPFDRLLVAQAQVENAVLVTADPVVATYPVTTLG